MTQANAKFESMGKVELRQACKDAGIKNYGKMNNDGMREALSAATPAKPCSMMSALLGTAPVAQVPATGVTRVVDGKKVEKKVDPRSLTVCPECGSTELYTGRAKDIGGGLGVVVDEETVGGCHHCDWHYDLRKGRKEAADKPQREGHKGYKIEKVREERVVNGKVMRRPSAGTLCGQVWATFDANPEIKASELAALAEKNGWNHNNVSCEFYAWRKFNGISGRSAK